MPDSPDIASVASLIGDRARATMLMCLMAGRSHTATELARAANVTKQTASSHLSKLVQAHLVAVESIAPHSALGAGVRAVGPTCWTSERGSRRFFRALRLRVSRVTQT